MFSGRTLMQAHARKTEKLNTAPFPTGTESIALVIPQLKAPVTAPAKAEFQTSFFFLTLEIQCSDKRRTNAIPAAIPPKVGPP